MRKENRRHFITKDPGSGNLVQGYLSTKRGRHYGALTIEKVNGRKVNYPPILGTPKLGYPFTRGGNFQFPSASEILCYKKYDGTNILAYRYWNAAGSSFIAYKVRLWPFLRGDILMKWETMLARYPIPSLFAANPDIAAFSFEMFGAEHEHLIRYEIALDTVLLFGIRHNGDIVVNRDIDCPDFEGLSIPKAALLQEVTGDYVWEYQQMQAAFGENLTLVDAENRIYTGEEGAVWYLKEKRTGAWKLLKCKPRQIELTHWAGRNATLPEAVLKATALNILTEHAEITLPLFRDYLAEEFPPHLIETSMPTMRELTEKLNASVENHR